MDMDLREEMLRKRKSIDPTERAEMNSELFLRLTSLSEFNRAPWVFTYISTDYEADTRNIIDLALAEGKRIAVPVVMGSEMVFTEIKGFEGLKKNRLGIYEPVMKKEAMPEKGDLFIVPGTVFDKSLRRFGYGKGYYDKYLAKHKGVLKIGFCYDFQTVEAIKTEPHDINMDMLVTDKTIIRAKGE